MKVVPARPMYRPGDVLVVTVDAEWSGAAEPAPTVRVRLSPAGLGTVSGRRVKFTGQGRGRLEGCVNDVCGSVPVMAMDDALP